MFTITGVAFAVGLMATAAGPALEVGPLPEPPPLTDQAARPQNQEQLDINVASAEDLQKVPGIGEALARRIVEFRQQNGRFEKVDDLLNVRGIGVASLDKMKAHLVVKPKAT